MTAIVHSLHPSILTIVRRVAEDIARHLQRRLRATLQRPPQHPAARAAPQRRDPQDRMPPDRPDVGGGLPPAPETVLATRIRHVLTA